MALIKCKMCGGDLRIEEGSSVCECEYCGTRQTVPSADNEKKLTLFSRAGRLLRGCEFDKAAGVFETIVADFPEEAEAYWGLVLCKYGIEYVDDPATGKKIPTCHRSSFDSVLDDPNFEQACENTDAVARRVYRDEARQIEDLRKRIIEVSGKEEPYDVFISYKETDENGDRTLDSVIAQDIYSELTEKGYRVFFSRISLEDKLGTEYEPYIFAALNSAKVMLVVGTDYENFDAVWVKNEWSRFLKLIASGQKKTLIPVFKNMDAYDMPKEFAKLAAQDMGKVGAMQDLVRGVEKLIGKKGGDSKQTVKETVVIQQGGGPNVAALLKRGQQALEDKAWDKAEEYYDQVLSMDAENAEAFFGLFLARENCTDERAYIDKVCRIRANTKTLSLEPATERIEAAIRDNVIEDYFPASEIRKLFEYDLNYSSTTNSLRSIVQQIKKKFSDSRELNRAFRYASGEMTARLESFKAKLFSRLDDMVKDAEKQEETAVMEKKAAYEALLAEAETTVREKRREAEAQKEADYQALCSKIEQASEMWEYQTAVEQLSGRFLNYKDSREKTGYCNRRIAEITEASAEEARRKREEKEKAEKAAIEAATRSAKAAATRKKKAVGILVSLAITAVAAILAFTKIVVPGNAYKNAESLLVAGKYEEAITAFQNLGNYRDSAARAVEANEAKNVRDYVAAEELLADGKYEEAITAFKELGEYRDSAARAAEADEAKNVRDYVAAEELLADGKYEEAITAFQKLGNYRDSEARVTESTNARDYAVAQELLKNGNTAQSAMYFSKLKGYKDAHERAFELWDEIVHRDTIFAGSADTIGLKTDGTVVAVGAHNFTEMGGSKWTDVVSLSSASHAVGLKADGTVVAVGRNNEGQCDVNDWTDIVAVSAGSELTVGLKADGTVVTVGHNYYVSNWTDIIAVSAGDDDVFMVGLKADGTVMAMGDNFYGQCNVSDWADIVAVSAGGEHTVGLKSDGTVVAVGRNNEGQCDVSDWTDIVAVSAGGEHTVGLKADGTVVAIGDNFYGQCNVSDWVDIVAVSAGLGHTVGLKADGTAVAVGYELQSRCDVSGWTDIKLPNILVR